MTDELKSNGEAEENAGRDAATDASPLKDALVTDLKVEATADASNFVVVADVVDSDSSDLDPSKSRAEEVVGGHLDEVCVAEVVSEEGEPRVESTWMDYAPPPIPKQFQNLAAHGGAVATLALGAFAIVGAFFSDVSAFNAIMGLCFGIWGATSSLKRTNVAGVVCCVIALVICIAT